MILRNNMCIIENAFTDDEVEQIKRVAKGQEEVTAMIGDPGSGGADDAQVRSGKVKWFMNQNMQNSIPDVYDKLFKLIEEANASSEWNHKIEFVENLQYTIYNAPAKTKKKKGDFYTWHTDSGPEPLPNGKIRKLSLSVQLSDPEEYEGGNFQWLEPTELLNGMGKGLGMRLDMNHAVRTVPFSGKTKGTCIIFPSFTYHQVTPVTHGTREALVGWFAGDTYV